jgi:tellurium resistance protein TerD
MMILKTILMRTVFDVFEKIVPEKASKDEIKTIADQKDVSNYSNNAQSVEDVIKCPKCGSIQITAGNKGFGLGKAAVGGVLLGPVGLLGGLVGSKKIIVTCLKCGNKGEAGQQ